MEFDELMQLLRAKGKTSTAQTYRRHGVVEETYGVSYADIGAIVKKIKIDHKLALALWSSAVHDARVIATKIADPEHCTRKQLTGWLKSCQNYIITGAVAELAARTEDAIGHAKDWIQNKSEWISSAGWQVYASLVLSDRLDPVLAEKLISKIATTIHSAQNRTRHSMNSALIAIGGTFSELRGQALKAAKTIGKVEVDHGATDCKTQDAAQYIARMIAHRKRPKRVSKPGAAK